MIAARNNTLEYRFFEDETHPTCETISFRRGKANLSRRHIKVVEHFSNLL